MLLWRGSGPSPISPSGTGAGDEGRFRQQRWLAALLVGLLCFALCWLRLYQRDQLAADFTFPWRAARALLAGENPYHTIQPTGAYPYQAHFYHPLTAALVALPFALLPPIPAGALFFGLSAGLLAYAITQDGWQRLPLFLSAPFGVALAVAQWTPLLAAAALLPGLEWLLACKPNLGAALFLYHPSRRALLGPVVFGLLSLLLLPTWPLDWLYVIARLQGHGLPVLLLPFGPLLLLAGLRWRTPQGRLLLGLSLLPQLLFFYDQLPLWLLPRTWKLSLAYAGLSWLGYFAWRRLGGMGLAGGEVTIQPAQIVMGFIYLPALGYLLLEHRQSKT